LIDLSGIGKKGLSKIDGILIRELLNNEFYFVVSDGVILEKVLILGAGPYQLSAIQKAVKMGLYVITLDYCPDNIGHRFSHQFVNCSTTDKEGVLKAAKDNQVDAICTFSSDIAVNSVAYVCESLQLLGPSNEVAVNLTQKNLFRQLLKNNALSTPNFISGDSWCEIKQSVSKLKYPLIYKPVDTSGSRGISKIEQPDLPAEKIAFIKAKEMSRSGKVCIEEFIEGIEVGGDGILINGHFAFIAITTKYLTGFVVVGHSLPTSLNEVDQKRVTEQLERVCVAAGYLNGPLNFDVMVTRDQIYVLEMSPRNGGNGIASIIELSKGVDVEQNTILMALNREPQIHQERLMERHVGSLVFGSTIGGVIKKMATFDELKNRVPQVLYYFQNKTIGQSVDAFVDNSKMLGFVIFSWDSSDTYSMIADRVKNSLQLEIQPL
jgi:biotin carboxylase